jgi:hypothetical protein
MALASGVTAPSILARRRSSSAPALFGFAIGGRAMMLPIYQQPVSQ